MAGHTAKAQPAYSVQLVDIRGFEVERLHRDAAITQIYERSQQIQRPIIWQELTSTGSRQ